MNNKSDLNKDEQDDAEFDMPIAPPLLNPVSLANGKGRRSTIAPTRKNDPVMSQAVLDPAESDVSLKRIDPANPLSWSAAAESGDALAMALLGDALCWGGFFTRGITQDISNGIRFLEKSASLEHPLGLYLYSRAQRTLPGYRAHPKIADQTEQRAIKAGFFDRGGDGGIVWIVAQTIAHLEGKFSSLDLARQLALVRAAFATEYTDAWTVYAYCLIIGTGVEQDLAEGVNWLRRAAVAQNGTSMIYLANCYRNGTGVKKNLQEALDLYEKSSLLGIDNALNLIGICIRNGIGCKRDPERAFQYYSRAAASGNPSGCYNVGFCYEKGIGVKKNIKEAREWYSRSADFGNEKAELSLKRI